MATRLPHHEMMDDDEDHKGAKGSKTILREFECPTCSAHNPYDEGFGDADEVLCSYCGLTFIARVDDEGRLKLRES